MAEHSRLTLSNDLAELSTAACWLDRLGEKYKLPYKTILELKLVLEEIVTNIINHAYEDNDRHQITINFSLENTLLLITVIDDGKMFDPLLLPDPDTDAPLEERDLGGLGIYFIRQLMDEVKYERKDGLNVLMLKKALRWSES